jgi:hypothetical protein
MKNLILVGAITFGLLYLWRAHRRWRKESKDKYPSYIRRVK